MQAVSTLRCRGTIIARLDSMRTALFGQQQRGGYTARDPHGTNAVGVPVVPVFG